jgi:RNA polymerase sigma factor (sigma-70 family)
LKASSLAKPTDPFPVDLVRTCSTSNDDGAWEQLLARCGPRLRASIRRSLFRSGVFPTRDRVEDLQQEVLCRLLERDRRVLVLFRGSTEAEAGLYLERVIANVVIDHLRAESAAKRCPPRAPLCFEDLLAGECPALEDREQSPESRLLALERGRAVLEGCARAVLRERRPDRRRALALALLGGYSSHEIAERLGGAWTRGAVDALVARARRRLAADGVELPARLADRSDSSTPGASLPRNGAPRSPRARRRRGMA